ncbi:MAG: metallophosphoesterase family protein, partial [Candidatus Thermoplasmatota archaeon]|nr:metallophosphoesterase family protein [Candidatus Thermoplasmatota archaeon]
ELGPIEEIPRKPHHEWVRSKLSKRQMEYLDSPKVEFFGDDPSMVFMHRHIDDWWSKVPYFYDSSPDVMDEFYREVPGNILFFGHTHIPLDVTGNGGRRYINPGAVGAENAGVARFVKIMIDPDDKIEMEHCSVPYDRDAVREDLRDQAPPYWEFISDHFYGPHPAGSNR